MTLYPILAVMAFVSLAGRHLALGGAHLSHQQWHAMERGPQHCYLSLARATRTMVGNACQCVPTRRCCAGAFFKTEARRLGSSGCATLIHSGAE